MESGSEIDDDVEETTMSKNPLLGQWMANKAVIISDLQGDTMLVFIAGLIDVINTWP